MDTVPRAGGSLHRMFRHPENIFSMNGSRFTYAIEKRPNEYGMPKAHAIVVGIKPAKENEYHSLGDSTHTVLEIEKASPSERRRMLAEDVCPYYRRMPEPYEFAILESA